MVQKHFAAVLVLASTISCNGVSSSNDGLKLDRQRLQEHVNFFSADSMQGRRAGSVHELEAAKYIRNQFSSYGISSFEQTFPFSGGKFPVGTECHNSPSQSLGGMVSQNVIGTLPGQGDLEGQWVVVAAHYDHLGCADTNGEVRIFNGADDNASGTATLLEIARTMGSDGLTSGKGRRSVMFQAFGTEEPGLLGSSYYVANPTVPLDSIVAVVNLDMIGRLRNNTLTLTGTTVTTGWDEIVANQNDDRLSLNYDDTFLSRGDHWSYLNAEVPAIHFFTGSHGEYHTTRDDSDLLDYEGLATVGELALRTVRALSIQNQLPRFGN